MRREVLVRDWLLPVINLFLMGCIIPDMPCLPPTRMLRSCLKIICCRFNCFCVLLKRRQAFKIKVFFFFFRNACWIDSSYWKHAWAQVLWVTTGFMFFRVSIWLHVHVCVSVSIYCAQHVCVPVCVYIQQYAVKIGDNSVRCTNNIWKWHGCC